jgi:TonB family protein
MPMAFAEEVVTAVLWFQPWVWLLRARIRLAREQAVDARVLELAGDKSEYVRCLVEMAGYDLAPHLGAGMLGTRELRARVDAIFEEVHMSRAHRILVSVALAAVVITTGWGATTVAPLHAVSNRLDMVTAAESPTGRAISFHVGPLQQPELLRQAADAARQAASQTPVVNAPRRRTNLAFTEYPIDALEKGIRGLVTVDITVNAAGSVTTAAVVSGPQEFRDSALKAAFGLTYEPGPSTTLLRVTVEYVRDRNSWGVRVVDRPVPSVVPSSSIQPEAGLTVRPEPSGEYRVGGAFPPPRRLKSAAPVYPEDALAAGIQGVVILELSIDTQGSVVDARVLRSIPELDQAAIDAVEQWEYEPALLEGTAVPIVMTVTVNFTVRQ